MLYEVCPVYDTNFIQHRWIWVDKGYNFGYTFGMKTAVSIPDELFESAEKLAEKLEMSRSKLYATALEQYVSFHDGEAITAKLNEIYASVDSSLDPVLEKMQSLSLPKEEW